MYDNFLGALLETDDERMALATLPQDQREVQKQAWMTKEQFNESITKSLGMILPQLQSINKHLNVEKERRKREEEKMKYRDNYQISKQQTLQEQRKLDKNLQSMKEHLEGGFDDFYHELEKRNKMEIEKRKKE